MPKKKLTKAQVKKKLKTLNTISSDLFMDKLYHPDNNVPLSVKILGDLNNTFSRAIKRIK